MGPYFSFQQRIIDFVPLYQIPRPSRFQESLSMPSSQASPQLFALPYSPAFASPSHIYQSCEFRLSNFSYYRSWLILLAPTHNRPSPAQSTANREHSPMCQYYCNYYVYSSCINRAMHYFKTGMEGDRKTRCPRAPHERFIVVIGECAQCP